MSQVEITRKVFNVTMKYNILGHRHSYPLLTGDTLQAFADWVYTRQNDVRLDVTKLKDGDVIFMRSRMCEHFATNIFPK